MAQNPISGNYGLSINDRVRMIERNKEKLVKGKLVFEVTFKRYDPIYDKVVEGSTLPTHSHRRAMELLETRENNPHYSNVKLISYTYTGY